jgi:hypothetical protein
MKNPKMGYWDDIKVGIIVTTVCFCIAVYAVLLSIFCTKAYRHRALENLVQKMKC